MNKSNAILITFRENFENEVHHYLNKLEHKFYDNEKFIKRTKARTHYDKIRMQFF